MEVQRYLALGNYSVFHDMMFEENKTIQKNAAKNMMRGSMSTPGSKMTEKEMMELAMK